MNRRKAILWTLVILNMAAIFIFSARNAEESSAQSGFIVSLLAPLFGGNVPEWLETLVRKCAHFTEFALLGAWAGLLSLEYGRHWLWGAVFASLYAVTDEVHQLFVPGRACQAFDWLVDTCGHLAGAGLAALIRKRRKRNN